MDSKTMIVSEIDDLPNLENPKYAEIAKSDRESYCTWNGAKHGEYLRFYPGGQIFYRSSYRQGTLHGRAETFSKEGIVLSTSVFVDGKRCGPFIRYYGNGKVYLEELYSQDLKDGMQLAFYEDGTKMSELTYKEGLLHGPLIFYYPSGRLKRTGHYEKGKSVGVESIYEEDGRLIEDKGCS